MQALPLLMDKQAWGAGTVQIVVWQVPTPVHPFKYRLVYIVTGQRVVGYDNERGKGDHKHLGGRELPYSFSTVAQLIADFWEDVRRWTA